LSFLLERRGEIIAVPWARIAAADMTFIAPVERVVRKLVQAGT
jgi:hypothetical protein